MIHVMCPVPPGVTFVGRKLTMSPMRGVRCVGSWPGCVGWLASEERWLSIHALCVVGAHAQI